MHKKIIIGLTGPMVTGKGTIASYLHENYGATCYGFSGPLRDVLKRIHLPIIRENMANLSTALRSTFGEDTLGKAILADIEEDESKLIVLDGVRHFKDVENAKQLDGFILVSVNAEQQTRYERLLKRSQNADDQSKTFEDFQKDEVAEADAEIPKVMATADLHLDNNGNFEDLYAQVDALMKNLLK